MPTPETHPPPTRDYTRTPVEPTHGPHRAAHVHTSPAPHVPSIPPITYIVLATILVPIVLPLDGPISRALTAVHLGGDIRREIASLQQYGQTLSSLLILLVIWLQHPESRRRLADLAGAWIITAIIVVFAKGLVGRPRPKFEDPLYFLGPFGEYPMPRAVHGQPLGLRHAWEFWTGISSDLWSMPSSHTAYAAVLSLFVATLYPRLKWLMFGLIAFVGFARVLTGAHYPTDVIVGAAIGLATTTAALRGTWGQRLFARWHPPLAIRDSRPANPPA